MAKNKAELNTVAAVKPDVSANASRRHWLDRLHGLWILGVFLVMIVIFGVLAPQFLSLQNWVSTSVYATETLLLAIGETFVIATAGIDLSVGAALGVSAITSSMVMAAFSHQAGVDVTLGVLTALFTGSLIGFINGVVITKMRITPFIVTLGMLGIASGVSLLLTGGNDITNIPSALGSFASYVFGGVLAMPVLVTAVVAIISGVVLSKTRFGRYTYAIGSIGRPPGWREFRLIGI